MLNKETGMPIQAMPLGRGNAVNPYTVLDTDSVVEFVEAGDVECTLPGGNTSTTTVLAGSRYSITNKQVLSIDFSGAYNVG